MCGLGRLLAMLDGGTNLCYYRVYHTDNTNLSEKIILRPHFHSALLIYPASVLVIPNNG